MAALFLRGDLLDEGLGHNLAGILLDNLEALGVEFLYSLRVTNGETCVGDPSRLRSGFLKPQEHLRDVFLP